MSFESNTFEHELVFKSGDTEMRVIPAKCLISGFKVKDWDVLYRPMETKNVKRAGMPLMIPNFSSLKDKTFQETGTKLPHHGFGRDKEWRLVDKREDGVTLELTPDSSTDSMYPFKWRFTVDACVSEHQVTHTVTMHNLEEEKTLPVQPGLHPYFTCPVSEKQNLKVDFSGFDPKSFDWQTKETCPDFGVPFHKRAVIKVPKLGEVQICEEPDAHGKYHYTQMQIWSDPASAPDHDFICFEPITFGPDGLNHSETRINVPPKGKATLVLVLKATPAA